MLATSLWFATRSRLNRAFLVDALSAQEESLRVSVAVFAQLLSVADRLKRVVGASVSFGTLARNALLFNRVSLAASAVAVTLDALESTSDLFAHHARFSLTANSWRECWQWFWEWCAETLIVAVETFS